MYQAYVTKLKNLRKHPNADRLLLGDCFGNTVCVSTDYTEDVIGVYFPTDGQLSVEFAEYNNLLRKKDDAGNNIGGYMDPDKRNVTAIRLRGEKSDGLFLPISCLDFCFNDGAAKHLNVGDTIDTVNGHLICEKYIPRAKNSGPARAGNRTRKAKTPIAPLFAEHADTEQLAYNLNAFKAGDLVEITLKMHGTSQRTAYLPVFKGYNDTWAMKVGNAFCKVLSKVTKKDYSRHERHGAPIYEDGYISGTRRVVLENYDAGYYGSNEFREQHSKLFEGKLWKGETVYYEVVGFTTTGAPIMGDASNAKLNDKDFVKQYGPITRFSYGCAPGTSDCYVYRMTMTNPDGQVVEYTPDFMRYRCEQMGVKTVPVLWTGCIPETIQLPDMNSYEINPGDYVTNVAERYFDGPDPIGKTHVREGVVVRIINRPKFTAYKHKNFSFKVLEGIIKASAETPDMEEAQEVEEDTE